MTVLHEIPWIPLSPATVAGLFDGWNRFWCVAGGWALDLHADAQSREHGDTDVLILRRDTGAIHDQLDGWEQFAADPPGSLRQWPLSEPLPDHVHDVWCRPVGVDNWQFQLMVMDHDEDHWIFRRDWSIGGPLESLAAKIDGVPVIAPEIQLMYKATSSNVREKDEADFHMFLPHLSERQHAWLREALERHKPVHPWLAELAP